MTSAGSGAWAWQFVEQKMSAVAAARKYDRILSPQKK
jgi:hypothetical protein